MGTDRVVAAAICVGGVGATTPALGTTAAPLPLIAHLCGLAAGYAVAVLIVLMARVPWLERAVGAALLMRWHAVGGRIVLLLALTHAIAATVLWRRDLSGLLSIAGMVAAVCGTGLLVVVGLASARAARRRLPHETWHAIHLTTYLAIGLCFVHQLAGPDLAGRRPLQIAWSLLYAYAFAAALRYRALEPVRAALRHRLVVEDVVRESADVVSILIRGRHLEEFAARPGQFFRWRFLTATTWRSAHPFSLSAPVRERHMRVTVKALGGGSRRLLELQPGARVWASGPYGRMPAPSGRPALLIAGGIGITPVRALFETTTAPRVTLIYRASTAQDVLFRSELDEIARVRGARVVYLVGSSSDPANAITASALAHHVPGLHDHDVFVCASPRFTGAVCAALDEAGIARRRVHVEQLAF